jgi:hypothetical protein
MTITDIFDVPSLKIAYVTNFKVAATSIHQTLETVGCQRIQYPMNSDDRTLFNTRYCFTFVRNPWDRLVSLFFGQLQKDTELRRVLARHWHINKEHECLNDFSSFIVRIAHTRDGTSNAHYRQQTYILNHLPQLDFVGRFEKIEDDWWYLRTQFAGLPPLLHRNQSDHKPYHHYYTDDLQQFVAERYSDDISRFGYCFV